MDDYEINILRRGGNWKKVKPNDLIIDEINNDLIEDNISNHQKSENDLLSYITRVDTIISRLETLENEKSSLKEKLKDFEDEFLKKKKLAEDEINNELNDVNETYHQKSENDLLSYITKVDSIIYRLETLENEKNKLKEELKGFEDKFLSKKKLAEDEISKISQEKEMIEKTINVIKNLKSF